MNILIAEDDLVSRRLLEATLQKWGYNVNAVGDGMAAWESLRKSDSPKLVILDWMMPEMDGVEVCRKVRAESNPTPPYILLLTAKSRKEDFSAGLEAGADDYVTKPFDRNELQGRLRIGKRVIELQEQLYEARRRLGEISTPAAS